MSPQGQKKERLNATLSGRVQGVFFRAWTQETAQRLGLTGWVRNNYDGSVELLAEGERAVLKEFLKLCWKGPPGAQVEDVQVTWAKAEGISPRFEIRR